MGLGEGSAFDLDAGRYCREIETYLCRKNDGHLIRIVGPAFDLVVGWAQQGIPLRVAYEGIDRFFERYYRKGPRRRPVHIAFCEGDVLDAFDAWRRATGVMTSAEPAAKAPARRRGSLAAHLERAVAALTARRAGAPARLDAALEQAVRELDLLRAAGHSRGDARAEVLDRLRSLDSRLVENVRQALAPAELRSLEREAEESLLPFRQRLSDAEWARARAAAVDRAVRSAVGLPVIAVE